MLRLIARADDTTSAAELTRRLGSAAEVFGLSRPSYQQVRVLLLAARRQRQEVTNTDVLIDIALRARPAYDLPNRLYGDRLPDRPGAKNEPRTT